MPSLATLAKDAERKDEPERSAQFAAESLYDFIAMNTLAA